MPAPPLATPLRVAVGLGLMLLVGLLVVAAARRADRRRPTGRIVSDLALAWALGPAVVVPPLAVAAVLGLPLRGRPLALALGALAAAAAGLVAVARPRSPAAGSRPPSPSVPSGGHSHPAWLLWGARLTLFASLGLAIGKLLVVRLWSWDHFAIWGLKARLFANDGSLDAAVVRRFELVPTVPDYPLGVPIAWLTATLGAVPAEGVVRVVHVGWLAALVLLVHAAALRLAGDRLVALAAAAFVAASPLAWDSSQLGVADLPLALFAVAAVALAAEASWRADGVAAIGGWGGWALAGLATGFLPWIKTEGATLAALLAATFVLWCRRSGRPGARGELAAFALPAVLLGGGAVAFGRLLPRGVSFFDGPWAERLVHRLVHPGEVLAPLASELAGAAWLGVWWILPVVLVVAALRRQRRAWTLAAVASAQLALYVAVFFTTYLAPADHVSTALPRIAATLVPLVALAAAALASPPPPGAPFARRTVP